jgi:hypothetical protein
MELRGSDVRQRRARRVPVFTLSCLPAVCRRSHGRRRWSRDKAQARYGCLSHLVAASRRAEALRRRGAAAHVWCRAAGLTPGRPPGPDVHAPTRPGARPRSQCSTRGAGASNALARARRGTFVLRAGVRLGMDPGPSRLRRRLRCPSRVFEPFRPPQRSSTNTRASNPTRGRWTRRTKRMKTRRRRRRLRLPSSTP